MPKSSSKPKGEYAIQTVTNALRMLEVFHEESEMGVSDLARRLGLHKNNAFRLLATLELAGYIQQTPATDLYHLGPRCLELGHAFARSHTLMGQARPILEELARDVGETAHLGVLSGRQVVHLDGVLPDQLVLTGLRVGERLDAHCTALGKTLLAGELADRSPSDVSRSATSRAPLPEGAPSSSSSSPAVAQQGVDPSTSRAASRGLDSGGGAGLAAGASDFAREISRGEFVRHTEATLDDPAKLIDDLRAIGLRGYATDLEEFAVGLRCVAAPIRDGSARVIAAISLSGPSLRFDEEALHGEIATAVTAAASRLSSELGSPI